MKRVVLSVVSAIMLCISTVCGAVNIEGLAAKAKDNDISAQYALADYYLQKDEYSQALYWFEKVANQGDCDKCYQSMAMVGILQLGYGDIEPDYQKAALYLELAAKADIPEADFNLGWLYDTGKLGSADAVKALRWYEKAVVDGSDLAPFNIGLLYLQGENGIALQYDKAHQWFEKAAALGDSRAEHNLAIMYLNGEGVAHSDKKGVYWLEKAVAHDQPESFYILGTLYLDGHGVKKNRAKARAYFKRACREGVEAACKLY